ncbi:hypothetical protein RAS1_02150 [Phycisphaerae bacterium RAS1]|nr:hypothetical protein RAS1_02150 [Phycisphaerae bacterium RAS1]
MITRITMLLFISVGCVAQQPGSTPPAGAASTAAPSDEPKAVRVTAEGLSRDDAVKQALRKALEEGAELQIAAFSSVENYMLMRQTIYSRAAGLVSDYRVLEEKEIAGGSWRVTVEAVVRPSVVAAAWGEVQNVLDQIGRPKIMVWIDEKIDGRVQEDSVVQTRLQQLFVKSGFDMVDRTAIDEIRRREVADARDEKNHAKLAALAKNAGAHLLIRGSANADAAGREDLYGILAAFYNCDVQARVYYTDTGRLLASESIPAVRRGVRSQKEHSPQAARAALIAATFPERENDIQTTALGMRLFNAVMEQWSTQITAGGEILLEVEGVEFKNYLKLKSALAEAGGERVKSIDGDFTKGIATYRIRAAMTAETFAELLVGRPFAEMLEVVDLKNNRIQAKAK